MPKFSTKVQNNSVRMHTISCILLYMLSIVQTNLASPVTSFKNSTHCDTVKNHSKKYLVIIDVTSSL